MSFKKHIAAKVWKSFTGKKTKGVQEDNPVVRKGIAKGLREHRKSESYKIYKKTMKKLKQNPDLSYLKGTLKD